MGKIGVVIAAAGQGKRMGGSESKQFLMLQGKPILIHTIQVFEQMADVEEIVLVVRPEERQRCAQLIARYQLSKIKQLVCGGAERQASVYAGLKALSGSETEWVMIHDAVRPFVTEEQVLRCLQQAKQDGAALLAVRVKDTIKMAGEDGRVKETPNRKSLWAVQTPQAFSYASIMEAHAWAEAHSVTGTDDAMLLERQGKPVVIVEGGYNNIKITTPEDLQWAEWQLQKQEGENTAKMRVGHGFDVHALVDDRDCIIGGVKIPYEKGLLGHSDADVLLHAISDAVLGALGEGDIGRHFPDTDPKFKGADSHQLLCHVWQLAKDRGYVLGNVDATVIAQAPKLAPYIPSMVERIAEALEADAAQINVKATTTEKLGFPGRGEGIAAESVVCVFKPML